MHGIRPLSGVCGGEIKAVAFPQPTPNPNPLQVARGSRTTCYGPNMLQPLA